MTGITVGNVPVIYTYPSPPPNNISDASMNTGQIIYDLSDSDNNSIGLYMLKGGAPGSQVWVRFASYAQLMSMAGSRIQSAATRALNTAFQISTTRDSNVYYSIDVTCTLSLSGGQTGTLILEIATNSAFTTGVQELGRFVNGNTGTLTVGLNITQDVTGQINGYVPANYWTRLRTVNTSGTPTFTYKSGQEVLM